MEESEKVEEAGQERKEEGNLLPPSINLERADLARTGSPEIPASHQPEPAVHLAQRQVGAETSIAAEPTSETHLPEPGEPAPPVGGKPKGAVPASLVGIEKVPAQVESTLQMAPSVHSSNLPLNHLLQRSHISRETPPAAPLQESRVQEESAPPLAGRQELSERASEPSAPAGLQPEGAPEDDFSTRETPELTLRPVSLRGNLFRPEIERWAAGAIDRVETPGGASYIAPSSPQVFTQEPPSILPQGRVQVQRTPAEGAFSQPGPVEPVSYNLPAAGSPALPAYPSMPLVTGIPGGRKPNLAQDFEDSTAEKDSRDGLATAILPSPTSVAAREIQRLQNTGTPTEDAATMPFEMAQNATPAETSPEESQEEEEEADLGELARKIYPVIKRMLAVERERFSGR